MTTDQTAASVEERVARYMAAEDWVADPADDEWWNSRLPKFREDYLTSARRVISIVHGADRPAAVSVPVQPSRAGVLREAADVAARWNSDCQTCAVELEVANELRRMADEEQPATEAPRSTAPLAAGLPLVKGNCPACGHASLFLGSGGYVTCSIAECRKPDAASTVLERRAADEEQPATETHPAEHTWAAELYDPVADEWVPGTRYTVRDRAVNHLAHAAAIGPRWKDGTPVQRRLVRATTTYTVEAPQ